MGSKNATLDGYVCTIGMAWNYYTACVAFVWAERKGPDNAGFIHHTTSPVRAHYIRRHRIYRRLIPSQSHCAPTVV